LGKIALVNSREGFVLMDIGTAAAPAAGSELRAMSEDGGVSTLVVSAFQSRPFLIADVKQGQPRQGDSVVFIRNAPSTEGGVDASAGKDLEGTGVTKAAQAAPTRLERFWGKPKADDTIYFAPAPAGEASVEGGADGVIPGLPKAPAKAK
jgi:hypothetical protein